MSNTFYPGQQDYLALLNTMWDYYAGGTQGYPSLHEASGRLYTGATNDGATLFQVNGSFLASGQVSLGGGVGAEALRVNSIANTTNRVAITGSNGGSPTLAFAGTSTDVSGIYSTRGVGSHFFNNSVNTLFSVGGPTTPANYLSMTAGATGIGPRLEVAGETNTGMSLFSRGTSPIQLGTLNGTRQVQVTNTTTAVNYLNLSGGIAGGPILISSAGASTDVGQYFATQGAGEYQFTTGGGTVEQFHIGHAAGAVNRWQVNGSGTGASVFMGAVGTDANINGLISPKGKGGVGLNWGQPPAKFSVAGNNVGTGAASIATISSVDTTTDTITTAAAHGFASGDVVFYKTTANGIAVTGSATDRWLFVNAPSATTLTIHNTLQDALSGVNKLDITANGTGTQTLCPASLVSTLQVSSGNGIDIDTVMHRHTVGTDWTGVSTRIQSRIDVSSQGYIEFNPIGNLAGMKIGLSNTSAAYIQLATSGGEQFRVANTVAAAEVVSVTGATTGGIPYFATSSASPMGVQGSKTWQSFANVSLIAGTTLDPTSASGACVVLGSVNGNSPYIGSSVYSTSTQSGLSVRTGGVEQFRFNHTASANNYWAFSGANGTQPAFSVAGASTNIGIKGSTKAAEDWLFYSHDFSALQVKIANVAVAVNYLQMSGATTTNTPTLSAQGETNVNLGLTAKLGYVDIQSTPGTSQMRVNHVASAQNRIDVFGAASSNYPCIAGAGAATDVGIEYRTQAAGYHFFTTGGNQKQVQINHAASAQNYLALSGGATNIPPSISARGETNAGLSLNSNGSGSIFLTTGGSSFASQVVVAHTASTTNYLALTGAPTGNRVSISTGGSVDTNRGVSIAASGSELIDLRANGGSQLVVGGSAAISGAGNYVQAQGSNAGSGVRLMAAGVDSNVTMLIAPKGSGDVAFDYAGFGNFFISGSAGSGVTIAARPHLLAGAAGTSPQYTVSGSDTDISVRLVAKGAGNIQAENPVKLLSSFRSTDKEKDTSAGLTAKTVTKQYTYLTGTAGASLALTLPAGATAIDGQIHTVMSTAARATTTWVSTGATFVGAPSALVANTPVTLQYHHATTEWFITN